jgi:sterol desaturase/sphingolipid hydroxylase (fatty acid hydroxylase superfamily)
MRFTKKLSKNLRTAENVIFILAFGLIMYQLISSYGRQVYDSIKGKGYVGSITGPIGDHQYSIGIAAVIIVLNSTLFIWEIIAFIVQLSKQKRTGTKGYNRYKLIYKKFSVNYKSSFLALLIHEIYPRLILLNMFWIWLPHIQKIGFFTINLTWYGWIYGYICYEFASWVYHFTCHRIRFLWCLHSPHHAPSEINMSVNWTRFFAESYYSAFSRLVILTLLGVNPVMFIVMISIDYAWGIFIHISERALKNGRLGILQYFMITPAHHRAHHAKNPLYVDTNFANVLPFWDWIFGTLQPLKEEVKADYGITRHLDVTNFSDLYFGEIYLLYRDVKNAEAIKNKLLYIVMPPGWTPAVGSTKTALAIRRDFLETNPGLGVTSKNKLLAAIRYGSKVYKLKVKGSKALVSTADDVNADGFSPVSNL